ncbi:fasciclin domain-containing protein [Aquimarina celericrescens]|nr:fasciclin domain-containing protein [Aquimarina celericrescens]
MKKSFVILGLVSMSFFACKEENKDANTNNETPTEMNESSSSEENNSTSETMNADEAEANSTSEMDLADVAMNAENLSTFVKAIEQAGMTVKIKGEGPFTIFAPTDEAFKQLPEGTTENLMKPENAKKLEAALSYHIIPGFVDSKKLKDLINESENKSYELTTANDGKITASINKNDKVVFTDGKGNKAMLANVDQKGKNGVIHSITTVLMRK